jgi:transposase
MDNSLSREATDWREGRRLKAFELKQEGWSQQQIAEALGVSKGAVSQWMKRVRDGGGVEALKRRPAPGARPRLSEEQRMKLPELVERGAEAHGFRGELWTCERVAIVIRREFGVSYHPAHVSRLLKALRQRACRSPSAERTSETRRPSSAGKKRGGLPSKRALKEGRTIAFADQSGFYLLPMVVRTYAPVGKTPLLKENLTRDHLSAMSAITLEGKLYMIEQERSFKGEDAVRFLKHLMRRIPGKLLVVWDGSPIHCGGAVKDFLASGAASRLQLEQLPGYAPDLNPDEGIWKHLKCVELKNLCCESLAELKVELRKAKERLRHKRDVILGCIRQPGFEV